MINYGKQITLTEGQDRALKRWKSDRGISTKLSTYNVISETKGLYLPAFTSRCVTQQYLDGVLAKANLSIPTTLIKQCNLDYVNMTIELLYFELKQILKDKKQNYHLGFDEFTLPDKKWLLNIMYTIDPLCAFFNKQFIEADNADKISMLSIDQIVGDESFKRTKHPAYCQFLYNKSERRRLKKCIEVKHHRKLTKRFNALTENKINKFQQKLQRGDTNFSDSELDKEPHDKLGCQSQITPFNRPTTTMYGLQESTIDDPNHMLIDSGNVKSLQNFKANMHTE